MRRNYGFIILAATALLLPNACGDSTEPPKLGALKSQVVAGRNLSSKPNVTAGSSVNEVFRNPLTGKVIRDPNMLERIFLPALAYAQQSLTRVTVAGAVSCVGEEQQVIVPKVRCVVSDQLGQSRIDWHPTTKAGTHKVTINATYGLEETESDTVTIVVEPGPVDPNYRTPSMPIQCSPAVMPPTGAMDIHGNGVPFRIASDTRITAQDTLTGSVGARTVVFTNATITNGYVEGRILGAGGVQIGRLWYQISQSQSICPGQAQVTWQAQGMNIP